MLTSIAVWALAFALLLQDATFVCPMHPEITSDVPNTCRRCGMAMIRRADPAAKEYDMRVRVASRGSDLTRFEFQFRRSDGSPPGALLVLHEQELHIFVVAQSLAFFDHVHPRKTGPGRYVLDTALPGPGDYMVFADFQPIDNNPHLLQQLVTVPGRVGSARSTQPSGVKQDHQVVDDMRITLVAERPIAGEPTPLTFSFEHADTGAPLTDLSPYLGSPAHLFFTDPEFQAASHSHPVWDEFGPQVRFEVRFVRAGQFRVWLQVKRREKVVTTEWRLDVLDR